MELKLLPALHKQGRQRRRLPVQGRDERHPSLEDAVKLRLEGGPGAAATARRALGRLKTELDPPVLENLRLLVTELITNAVRHAGARSVDMLVVVSGPAVRVEVIDPGPGFAPPKCATVGGPEGGWGLFLVDRMSDRWGVGEDEPGTRVWFELDRRSRQAA
jgi:anti-sigma regulatory factor (Ser/Thr protein kinase)